MREDASLADLPQEFPPNLKMQIASEIASVLGRVRKTDCEVQEVYCEEERGPMVNHGPEDLGMTTKVACASYVRQTMEVAENAQKGPIAHLIALTHWQRTWPGWRPLQNGVASGRSRSSYIPGAGWVDDGLLPCLPRISRYSEDDSSSLFQGEGEFPGLDADRLRTSWV